MQSAAKARQGGTGTRTRRGGGTSLASPKRKRLQCVLDAAYADREKVTTASPSAMPAVNPHERGAVDEEAFDQLFFNLFNFRLSGWGGLNSADLEVYSVQALIPGCKGVLSIGAERAADLGYTSVEQVRVKRVEDDQILVGYSRVDARAAWVNAGEVSITQAGTQPVLKVEYS